MCPSHPEDPEPSKPSTLILDEHFESGSEELVPYLRRFRSPKITARYADRWKSDPRPELRALIQSYASSPMDVSGHEPLVKRLFKHAESEGDHVAMGWWAAAFDRLVRRKRRAVWHWDSKARESYTVVELCAPRNRTVPNAQIPELQAWGRRPKSTDRLFSYATRHYLSRRAWRYFRRLGHMQPEAYVPAVASMLLEYRDEDLSSPENVLDSRTLMHACFMGSEALDTTSPRTVDLAPNRSLSEVKAAPYHPELWRAVESFDPLLDLIEKAPSTVVRVFALTLLEEHHMGLVPGIDPERLLTLMGHEDPRVSAFAASAFENSTRLASLELAVWLRLLGAPDSPFLAAIVSAFEAHVDPSRVSLAERFRLATARPAPVAALGLRWVQESHGRAALSREQLGALAEVRSSAAAGEAARWALETEALMGPNPAASVDFLTRFFDAPLLPVRRVAMERLTADSAGWNEPELWTRLVESPHDDVRFGLLERLDARGSIPGSDAAGLEQVWTSVILGVHRGSRWKPRALQQIVDALVEEPDGAHARGLVGVLAIAVRSIRSPERLAGLGAVARLVSEAPQLGAAVEDALPDLSLDTEAIGVGAGGH